MAPTERQREAITRHDMSMVVTAGAGTGKTFVLVEKYLHLIEDQGYRLRDVLALTFTDKAAAEMKERVRATVADRLEKDPYSKVWKEASEELVIAPVMTFHSFCSQILREFAIEAGLDPGFTILDEGQALAVRREALDTLIRRPSAAVHDTLVRVLTMVDKYSLSAILDAVSDNYPFFLAFFSRICEDPEEVLSEWIVFLDSVREPAIKEFFSDRDITGAIYDLIRFGDIYEGSEDTAVTYLAKVRPALLDLTPDSPPEVLSEAADLFLSIRPPGRIGSQKVWDKDDLAWFRNAKKLLTEALEKYSPYFSLTLDPESEFTRLSIRFFQDLSLVAGSYMDLVSSLKKKESGVDFGDLIRLTKQFLITNPELVATHIRPRWRYILVDEFQDTDPAQFDIITAIIGDLTPDTRGLFIVGDPKQSIYLFRNADVTRFKEAQHRILSDCHGGVINLDVSFRSSREVIGCVNYLFGSIFSSAEKAWEFGYEPIQISEGRKGSKGSVRILLPGKAETGSSRSETKEIEAGMVADLVHEIVSTGALVIADRDGQQRTAGYGDIAILIERRTHLARYTMALSRKETPYYVHGGIGFYSRQEIYDIYNILSFLLRPFDDAALYGVLRSPYFCLSDATLYRIRQTPGQYGERTLLSRLCQYAAGIRSQDGSDEKPSTASPEDEKILRAVTLLQDWQNHAGRESLVLLISRIIRDSSILTIYGAMELGEQQAANLMKLLQIARGRSESGSYGLFEFVRDMTLSINDEEREGEAALDTLSKTSVNIMTVHAAKGLEFPVVILPDMGSSKEGSPGPILTGDSPFHVGVKIPNPEDGYEPGDTPVFRALNLIRKEKELAERKRLFYVGTTRARDHLILCGKQPDTIHDIIDRGKNRIDWVCTLFGIDKDTAEQGGIVMFDPDDGAGAIEVQVMTDPDQLTRVWACEEVPRIAPPGELAQRRGTWGREQPAMVMHEDAPVSISRIIACQPDLENTGGDRAEFSCFAPLTPDEIGTLLHQVLSGADIPSVLSRYGVSSDEAVTFCSDIFQRFTENPLISTSTVSYSELSFIAHICGYPVSGRMDRLCQLDDGSWMVIDYKSGNEGGATLQLNIYKRAAEQLLGTSVKMGIYSILTGEMREPDLLSDQELAICIALAVREER